MPTKSSAISRCLRLLIILAIIPVLNVMAENGGSVTAVSKIACDRNDKHDGTDPCVLADVLCKFKMTWTKYRVGIGESITVTFELDDTSITGGTFSLDDLTIIPAAGNVHHVSVTPNHPTSPTAWVMTCTASPGATVKFRGKYAGAIDANHGYSCRTEEVVLMFVGVQKITDGASQNEGAVTVAAGDNFTMKAHPAPGTLFPDSKPSWVLESYNGAAPTPPMSHGPSFLWTLALNNPGTYVFRAKSGDADTGATYTVTVEPASPDITLEWRLAAQNGYAPGPWQSNAAVVVSGTILDFQAVPNDPDEWPAGCPTWSISRSDGAAIELTGKNDPNQPRWKDGNDGQDPDRANYMQFFFPLGPTAPYDITITAHCGNSSDSITISKKIVTPTIEWRLAAVNGAPAGDWSDENPVKIRPGTTLHIRALSDAQDPRGTSAPSNVWPPSTPKWALADADGNLKQLRGPNEPNNRWADGNDGTADQILNNYQFYFEDTDRYVVTATSDKQDTLTILIDPTPIKIEWRLAAQNGYPFGDWTTDDAVVVSGTLLEFRAISNPQTSLEPEENDWPVGCPTWTIARSDNAEVHFPLPSPEPGNSKRWLPGNDGTADGYPNDISPEFPLDGDTPYVYTITASCFGERDSITISRQDINHIIEWRRAATVDTEAGDWQSDDVAYVVAGRALEFRTITDPQYPVSPESPKEINNWYPANYPTWAILGDNIATNDATPQDQAPRWNPGNDGTKDTNNDGTIDVNNFTFYFEGFEFYTVNAQCQVKASVEVRRLLIDLDVDSDNRSGAFEISDLTDEEDNIEADAPGKLILVNDGDWNQNLIPDFADGYSETAVTPTGTDPNASLRRFTPIVLSIDVELLDQLEGMTVEFNYDQSAPQGVTSSPSQFEGYSFCHLPDDTGVFRLWLKNGNSTRNSKSVADNGDFIPSGERFPLDTLTWDEDGHATVYVEAVRESSLLYGRQIAMNSDLGDDVVSVRGVHLRRQTATTYTLQRATFVPFAISGLGYATPEEEAQWLTGQYQDVKVLWGDQEKLAIIVDPTVEDEFKRPASIEPGKWKLADDGRMSVIGGQVVGETDDLDDDRIVHRLPDSIVYFEMESELFNSITDDMTLASYITVQPLRVVIDPVPTDGVIGPPLGSSSLLGYSAVNVSLYAGESVVNLAPGFAIAVDVAHGTPTAVAEDSAKIESNYFTFVPQAPGTAVFLIFPYIDDFATSTLASERVSVDIDPLVINAPDFYALSTARANIRALRANLDAALAPTPIPGDPNYVLSELPGALSHEYATESALALWATHESAMYQFSQIMTQGSNEWMELLNYDWEPNVYGLARGTVDSFMGRYQDNGLAKVTLKYGPELNLHHRYKVINDNGGAKAEEQNQLKYKARSLLDLAFLAKLKLEFSIKCDETTFANSRKDITDGNYFIKSENEHYGGAVIIGETGFWDDFLHRGSAVEDLFDSIMFGVTYQDWMVGHPYTNDVLIHMIQQRQILIAKTFENIASLSTQNKPEWPIRSDTPGWSLSPFTGFNPIANESQLRGFPIKIKHTKSNGEIRIVSYLDKELEKLIIESIDEEVQGEQIVSWVSDVTPNAYYLYHSDAAREAPNWAMYYSFWNVIEGQTVQPSIVIDESGERDMPTGDDSQAKIDLYMWTQWERLQHSLKEYFLLREMLEEVDRVACWQELRKDDPLGYVALIVGETFFSMQTAIDLAFNFKYGVTAFEQRPMSNGEMLLSAGMLLVDWGGGSVLMKGGGIALRRATRAAAFNDLIVKNLDVIARNSDAAAAMRLINEVGAKGADVSSLADDAFRAARNLPEGYVVLGARALPENFEILIANVDDLAKIEHADDMIPLVRQMKGYTTDVVGGKGAGRAISPGTASKLPGRAAEFYEEGVEAVVQNQDASKFVKKFEAEFDELGGPAGGVAKAHYVAIRLADDTVSPAVALDRVMKIEGAACFPGGTKVLMADGSARDIDQIAPGDWVQSRDQAGGAATDQVAQVVSVERSLASETVSLYFESEAGEKEPLVTTPLHPFWVIGTGWTEASRLQPGMQVATLAGTRTCASVVPNAHATPVAVYNLEIAGAHTYYVSIGSDAEWIWVHNRCYRGRRLFKTLVGDGAGKLTAKEYEQVVEGLIAVERGSGLWLIVGKATSEGDGSILRKSLLNPNNAHLNDIARIHGLDASDFAKTWQAHHILASNLIGEGGTYAKLMGEGFEVTLENGTKRYFPGMGMRINHASNGIFLPSLVEDAHKYGLPLHFTNHPGYDAAWGSFLSELQGQVVKQMKEGKSVDTVMKYANDRVEQAISRAKTAIIEGNVDGVQTYVSNTDASQEFIEDFWLSVLDF